MQRSGFCAGHGGQERPPTSKVIFFGGRYLLLYTTYVKTEGSLPCVCCRETCHALEFCSRREKEGARVATQFTSPFYLQELAGGLNFPVGAHGFRGPVVWRRLVAGRRGGRKVVFFP